LWHGSAELILDHEINLDFLKRVRKYGYKAEEFTVYTEDNYVLKVHNIKKSDTSPDAPVVFLQHGIFSCSEFWFKHLENSPAFILVNQGYNVFIGNSRGNKYSDSHKFLDSTTDKKQFNDFSFYELGKYDAPAQIDFVLRHTNKEKLVYIGHSQGTTQMFSALAEGHGNLQDKISHFIALAPAVNFKFDKVPKKEGLV